MSSFYENQQPWSAGSGSGNGAAAGPTATATNQSGSASWEGQTPPARSGANSAVPKAEDISNAFQSQFEEIDRALDNLVKSGKMWAGAMGRRESMPGMHGGQPPRPFPDQFDARMTPPHRHSLTDFPGGGASNDARASMGYGGANLQSYYASQRQHNPSRGAGDDAVQAKRRMAANRERELRNYHQEQQYNRTGASSA